MSQIDQTDTSSLAAADGRPSVTDAAQDLPVLRPSAVVAHAELAGAGGTAWGDPDAALVDLPALLGLSFEEEDGGGGKEGPTMMTM